MWQKEEEEGRVLVLVLVLVEMRRGQELRRRFRRKLALL
jgi:hypothetical protein